MKEKFLSEYKTISSSAAHSGNKAKSAARELMRQVGSPYTQLNVELAQKGEEIRPKKVADERTSVTREKLLALSFIIDEKIARD